MKATSAATYANPLHLYHKIGQRHQQHDKQCKTPECGQHLKNP